MRALDYLAIIGLFLAGGTLITATWMIWILAFMRWEKWRWNRRFDNYDDQAGA